MSGVEVAGIVLGVFPILQDSAKGLRAVFVDLQAWWRFETEFEGFISTLETEHIKYSQSLEILLEKLEISDEDKETLQNDPTCTLWYEPKIQAELRQRIGRRYYEWFMRQLYEMHVALKELHEILTYGKLYHADNTSLESEMFRLKTSFTHSKDKLIGKVEEVNKTIYEFLERASQQHTAAAPSAPAARQTKAPLNVKDIADTAYKCFQANLRCHCASVHPCGITVTKVDKKRGQSTVHMKLLFQEGVCRTQVRIESMPQPRTQPLAQTPNTPAASVEPPTALLEEVSIVKQQFSVRNRLGGLRRKSPKSLFALASASMPTFNASASHLSAESAKDGTEKTKKRRSPRFRFPSFSETKPRPPEQEAYNPYSNPYIQPPPQSQTPPRPAAPRGVRFADPTPQHQHQHQPQGQDPEPYPPAVEINDLCLTLKAPPRKSCLGYLETALHDRLTLTLDPTDHDNFQHFIIETVESFLNATPRRDVRIKVGYSIAVAIINLGGTSWLPESWKKTDVFLVRDPTKPVPEPYLNHSSLRSTLSQNNAQHTPAATKARVTLFSLGVLLLELVFREKLENQPFRASLLGKDGKPNEATDLATALMWQQRVEEEFGDELAEAIKRCLVCMFDLAPAPDLGSSVFLRAVWQQVVVPVEKFLSAWSRY